MPCSCSWAILMRARASTVENHNVIDACIAGMLADLRRIGAIFIMETCEIDKRDWKGNDYKHSFQIEENKVESLKRDKAATEKLLFPYRKYNNIERR
ncbi:hypothetical protein Tco_0128735 [Tanacetum coccineum]